MIEVGLSAKRRMVEFEGHVPMLLEHSKDANRLAHNFGPDSVTL